MWTWIFGAAKALLPSIKDVAEVFVGNRKDRERNEFDEQIAIHKEQGDTFTYQVANRTYFDGFIDGINRLPRPLMTLGIIYLVILAVRDPSGFSVAMKALETVPVWLSTIITIIIVFWFGSRAIAKDIPRQVQAAKLVSPSRKAVVSTASPEMTGNSVIDDWKSEVFKQD